MKSTADFGLVDGKHIDTGRSIVEYLDSDSNRDLDKRRSMTSYAITIFGCTSLQQALTKKEWKKDILTSLKRPK